MAREAILKVSDELLPEETETVCLAHIVTGEDDAKEKVGVLSCSGEECLDGTISRLATRKVMEDLRAGKVVTLFLENCK